MEEESFAKFKAPEVQKCFGCLSLRVGTFLIALLELASGITGLAAVILYGLAEKSILSNFVNRQINECVRKKLILLIGFSSFLLTLAGYFTLHGTITKGKYVTKLGAITLVVMCCMVLAAIISVPVSCFFFKMCFIKGFPIVFLVLCFIFVAVFLHEWFYFAVVIYSYAKLN